MIKRAALATAGMIAIAFVATAFAQSDPSVASKPPPEPSQASPAETIKQHAKVVGSKVGRGLQRAGHATNRGLHKAASATKHGLEKAGEAIEHAAEKTKAALSGNHP